MRSRPVVCFGEALMRLDTPGHQRFVQAESLGVTFAGGEANVGVDLVQWGWPARIVSKVPAHELGDACVNFYRRYGLDTQFMARGGDRIGLFFVENGASQRGSKVLYDRANSAFRNVTPDDFDWNAILDGAGWFHVSGTAPALGEPVRNALNTALQECRRREIPVSFDCSYRRALWTPEEAGPVFRSLAEYIDVLIGSEQDATQFFGITETGEAGQRAFRERYGFDVVAYTDRDVTPTGINRYWASVLRSDELVHSQIHEMSVVDRIGTGDAFTAGLIWGLLRNRPLPETVEFAVAAAVLKHTIPGDFALLSVAEVEQLACGQGIGRVQR